MINAQWPVRRRSGDEQPTAHWSLPIELVIADCALRIASKA
jgi:hypothetical protein